ncbi:MAG: hypothetical protein ACJZ12_02330 [Candidatus Neomarinimicrobiota bacterium]
MDLLLLTLLMLGLSYGQELDEIEVLVNDDRFISNPAYINKKEGLWYISNSNELYTGRIEVFVVKPDDFIHTLEWQEDPEIKVAECTIIQGQKNGFFSQFYNNQLMLSGIIGLYVNDKKEGTWTWIDPENGFHKYSLSSSSLRKITSIDFRDGTRHGSIIVHKLSIENQNSFYSQNHSYPVDDILIKGQYDGGNKTGEWLIDDHILSDHNRQVVSKYAEELSLFWTRKDIYENDELIDRECREPWDRYVDCDSYQEKYFNRIISLHERKNNNKLISKTIQLGSSDMIVLKDNIGQSVEVDIMKFIKHVDEFHSIGTSTHKEQDYVFTINDKFRKMLKEKYWD